MKISGALLSDHGCNVSELSPSLLFSDQQKQRRHLFHTKTFHCKFWKVKYYCLYLSFTLTAVWLSGFSFLQGLSDEAAEVVYQMKRVTSVGQREEKAAY